MSDGWRPAPRSLSVFESVAHLFSATTPDVRTRLIEAGPSWDLTQIPDDPDGLAVWGNIPASGSSVSKAVRWVVGRETALRRLRRRHAEAIRRVHRLPPAVRTSRLPPAVRSLLLGGLLVELGSESHPRVIDRVMGDAGVTRRRSLRLRPSRDGSAIATLALEDGTLLELRVAAIGGRKDPARNAEALTVLADHGVTRTPRLHGRGTTAGASWTTETRLPGRLPSGIDGTLLRDLTSFCAELPRRNEPTSLRDRMLGLADRYPRWAALARQLAHREITAPGILQHGDFWIGNVLVHRRRLSGVFDWDTWHPAGVPGVDLLQLHAMEQRRRTGADIGGLWTSGLWRSPEFVSAAAGYWRSVGVTVTEDFLESLGLDWWSGQLFKRQSFARLPGWVEQNIDRVLENVNGTR